MKKMILFIAAMLLVGTTAQATDHKLSDQVDRVTKRYRHAQPTVFAEGGVKFLVYPNGEIDFKTPRRRNRQLDWNSGNYNTPGRTRGYRQNNRFTVRYDYYGRLKRVGLNTISYNRFDQVRRVGSVLMRYNRRGKLVQVGGLHIYYGKRGRIKHIEGSVHHTGCGFCGVDGCSMPHDSYYTFNKRPYRYDRNDYNDHYQYRKRKNDDDDDDDDDD